MQIKRNSRTRLGRILGLNRQGMRTVEFANLITDSGVESEIRVSNLQLFLNSLGGPPQIVGQLPEMYLQLYHKCN
jgi:hypothetical protein